METLFINYLKDIFCILVEIITSLNIQLKLQYGQVQNSNCSSWNFFNKGKKFPKTPLKMKYCGAMKMPWSVNYILQTGEQVFFIIDPSKNHYIFLYIFFSKMIYKIALLLKLRLVLQLQFKLISMNFFTYRSILISVGCCK